MALALTVGCLSCSSWALSVLATTSSTTCSGQLRELATQLYDAFHKVVDDTTEIAPYFLTYSHTMPPTGGTSTLLVAIVTLLASSIWYVCCHTWTWS